MKNYKEWIGSVFDGSAATYGTEGCSYFNHFAEKLVELVNPPAGSHVLDIATGRGAILQRAAKKIGPQGKAIGIDISAQMVEQARRELYPLQIEQMDAESLNFADHSFDIVFCGFAIFFIPDLKRALSEFKRVLKKDGVLALSFWGKFDECDILVRVLAEALGANPKIGVHKFENPAEVIPLLKEAGFHDISAHRECFDQIHPTIDVWWNSLWSHGVRGVLEQLSDTQNQTLLQQLNQKLTPQLQSDGLHEKLEAFYILATPPSA